MNEILYARDRLQPALLDRLIDDAPLVRSEPVDAKTISKNRLREIVLRDLSQLFNACGGFDHLEDRTFSHVKRSVLNFGVPPLSGQLVSRIELFDLEQTLRRAIIHFEPRILADTVTVSGCPPKDELGHHNVLEFEITGRLWALPYPLELLLKTELDLETGLIELSDGKLSAQAVRAEGR